MIRVMPVLLTAAAMFVGACASTTTIDAGDEPWDVHIQTKDSFRIDQDAADVQIADTTFGRYAIKVSREGKEPFYGRLPQLFVDERVLWDLLFPPLLAFNLRVVYPYYQIDPDAGVIRYRANETDDWLERKPTQFEIDHAKSFFRD